MRMWTLRIPVLLSISVLGVGCAGTKDSVLPHDGPTMQAIYDAHFAGMNGADGTLARAALGPRPVQEGDTALNGYTRDSDTELDTHFPRLPNPTLVMYVFPHLGGAARVPIPGYSTTFPLYARPEYALPGEVPVHTTLINTTPEARP